MASEPRSRRFLPGDPRVEEPYRLTPQLALRVAILGFVALAVFAVLFLRLWALQVLSGSKYLKEASDNRVRNISDDAPRGWILDRNGHPLVEERRRDEPRDLACRPAEVPQGPGRRAEVALDGGRDAGQGDRRADEAVRRTTR